MLLLLTACTNDKPLDTNLLLDSEDSDRHSDSAPPDYTAALEEIRAVVETDLRRSSFASGASVAIWLDGTILMAEGFGSAHPDQDIPVLPTTLFQIGSDTKKLTAIALLQEVDAEKLSLDDTLSAALPDLELAFTPSYLDDLTLHHLLSHQSGLFDYTPWTEAREDSELASRTYGRFAENEPVMAAPGAFWNYCNPNFSLAGLVVEESKGRPYADILEEDVFKPLGMTRSFARQSEAEADGDIATPSGIIFPDGYDTFDPWAPIADYEVGTIELEENPDNAWTRPAGLIWSTATDMALLGAFLLDGNTEVLSEASREALTSPQVMLYPMIEGQSYGYGLMIVDGFQGGRSWYRIPVWLHGGNTMGMTSTFYILPEQRLVVSILSNGYGDDFSSSVVTAITSLLELPEPESPPSYPPPLGDYTDLAGSWLGQPGDLTMELWWDGEQLRVEIPELEEQDYAVGEELEPAIEDFFYLNLNGYNYDLTLIRDTNNQPQYLKNRQFVFTRQP